MRIAFIYDGYASLNGTPDHLVPRLDPMRLCDAPHGLSGTEVNMFGLADELARRGHEVHIYSKWTDERIGRYGIYDEMPGIVRYCELDPRIPEALSKGHEHWRYDLVCSYHDARPLGMWDSWAGKRPLMLAHHQSYGLSPQEDARQFADAYWTPTERVSRYHRERRGWDVHTIPNAWDYGTFHEWKPVPGRLIYTTSMERGFHRLVEAFPLIKERVPEAHIVAFGRGGPDATQRMIEMLLNQNPYNNTKEDLDAIDFEVRSHSSRNQVLEILATASCMAYPCDVPSPCEVWPMSVTDALATGVPVVLAPDDGIEEVFRGGAYITPEVKKGNWLEEFVYATYHVLSYPKHPGAFWSSEKGREWAAPFTFRNQCDQFLQMVEKRI